MSGTGFHRAEIRVMVAGGERDLVVFWLESLSSNCSQRDTLLLSYWQCPSSVFLQQPTGFTAALKSPCCGRKLKFLIFPQDDKDVITLLKH